jgi:hypothetical protein
VSTNNLRAGLLGVATCLGLLGGCTGDGPAAETSRPHATSSSPGAGASPTQGGTPVQYVDGSSDLVQRLWRPVETLPRMRTVLPRHLDTDVIERAPSLIEAPIDKAVLAVGTDPAPYSVDGVAVMSPRGAWRTIDRRRLGMRNPELVEQQYMLAADGRTLALGDEHGIVLVDLATASTVRIPTDARDVVLHAWTPDSRQLIFTPRSAMARTLVLDLASRTVSRAGFRAWASSMGPEGQIVELVPPATTPMPTYTALRTWQTGRESDNVPLQVRVPGDLVVGRAWGPLVPVLQFPWNAATNGAAQGVLALDPSAGQGVGLLALGPRLARWTSMPGVMAGGWILLNIAPGPGGGLVAWDPVRERLRAVTSFDEQAMHVSIASQLLQSDRA